LTYELLRTGGVQWPCTVDRPHGTERLYADGSFTAHPDTCESYGRDLETGTPVEVVEYRSLNPDGKALLKAARFRPPPAQPTDEYPFHLITGRTIYHFHTRTKTGRVPELQRAAPEVWVEASAEDAEEHGWQGGDLLEITTPRGRVRARLRVAQLRPGVVFLPFHYGYWDLDPQREHEHARAANELTPTTWDPASKQPLFKSAVAGVARVGDPA
jgi:anaerobic selenocysteine-containing dehydrogenase